jgi:3',5'-cyclic AMP phosphodiesterase CpdA
MRLLHLSDLHYGAVDPGLPDGLRAAILAAAPDLVAVSGDLSQRGLRREFVEAKRFLDSLPQPQVVVPGNHDVQGTWNFWERFLHPFKNYREIVDRDLEPVWRGLGALVIGTNSARPAGWHLDWSRGRLSGRQMGRLVRLGRGSEEGALRVLVVHHPPAVPPRGTARHLIGRLREFTDAVDHAGIDLVLAGHFHWSYAQAMPLGGAARSCVLSCVSTATSHRLKGEANGFHVIDVDAEELLVTDWAWDGLAYGERRSWRFRAEGGAAWGRRWRQLGEGSG